jgi:hypothetical protein
MASVHFEDSSSNVGEDEDVKLFDREEFLATLLPLSVTTSACYGSLFIEEAFSVDPKPDLAPESYMLRAPSLLKADDTPTEAKSNADDANAGYGKCELLDDSLAWRQYDLGRTYWYSDEVVSYNPGSYETDADLGLSNFMTREPESEIPDVCAEEHYLCVHLYEPREWPEDKKSLEYRFRDVIGTLLPSGKLLLN